MHSVSKSPPPPPPSRITPCYGTIIMGSPVHVNEPHKTNTVSHRYMYMYIQCTCSGGVVHHKVVRSRHQLILAWQWQFKCLMHNEIIANSFVKVQKVLIVWTAVALCFLLCRCSEPVKKNSCHVCRAISPMNVHTHAHSWSVADDM